MRGWGSGGFVGGDLQRWRDLVTFAIRKRMKDE